MAGGRETEVFTSGRYGGPEEFTSGGHGGPELYTRSREREPEVFTSGRHGGPELRTLGREYQQGSRLPQGTSGVPDTQYPGHQVGRWYSRTYSLTQDQVVYQEPHHYGQQVSAGVEVVGSAVSGASRVPVPPALRLGRGDQDSQEDQ